MPVLGAVGAELDADALDGGLGVEPAPLPPAEAGCGTAKRPLRVTDSFGLTREWLASKEPGAPEAAGVKDMAMTAVAGRSASAADRLRQ